MVSTVFIFCKCLKPVIGSIDDVLAEVHFLKDIYTEEEIHIKLMKEIDKV